jgi:TRAP-type uncharacterized transport system substrate-binding protein
MAALYVAYRLADPLPPRRFAIAAGIPGTTFDAYARQYAKILARDGVELQVRNYDSAIQHFDALRDSASGVQAALTNFSFSRAGDEEILCSLGGISDTPIFIFVSRATSLDHLTQFRGKRVSMGQPGSALRALMVDVLIATGAWDDSIHLVDFDYREALQALIKGDLDVAIIPGQFSDPVVQEALTSPGVQIMDVAQAEAIAKTVAGLKHVVLSRGLVSLPRDIPSSDVDMLALHNRLLVRRELHPALQYLLLRAMREVHGGPGPFNRLGEFPSEQPNDLPLSATAQAFYRSAPILWQQYLSFWMTSLLSRIGFFVIPIIAALIPLIGFAPRFYRWVHVHPLRRLHWALSDLERKLAQAQEQVQFAELRASLDRIASAVHSLKVPLAFEPDLHLLQLQLRMVNELFDRQCAMRSPIDEGA